MAGPLTKSGNKKITCSANYLVESAVAYPAFPLSSTEFEWQPSLTLNGDEISVLLQSSVLEQLKVLGLSLRRLREGRSVAQGTRTNLPAV